MALNLLAGWFLCLDFHSRARGGGSGVLQEYHLFRENRGQLAAFQLQVKNQVVLAHLASCLQKMAPLVLTQERVEALHSGSWSRLRRHCLQAR